MSDDRARRRASSTRAHPAIERASDPPTSTPLQATMILVPRIRELFTSGHLQDALALADAVLSASANPEIEAIAARCQAELTRVYVARLGRLSTVPTVMLPPSRWLELDLDARECFLLAHVDGISTIEMIVETSGLPKHDALRMLLALLDRGVIALD